jgi:hypothetical protein
VLAGESNARSNISSLPELLVEPVEASESMEEIEEREFVDVDEEVRGRGRPGEKEVEEEGWMEERERRTVLRFEEEGVRGGW